MEAISSIGTAEVHECIKHSCFWCNCEKRIDLGAYGQGSAMFALKLGGSQAMHRCLCITHWCLRSLLFESVSKGREPVIFVKSVVAEMTSTWLLGCDSSGQNLAECLVCLASDHPRIRMQMRPLVVLETPHSLQARHALSRSPVNCSKEWCDAGQDTDGGDSQCY
jgi:hypothetical protein